jgi:hypothetical protein
VELQVRWELYFYLGHWCSCVNYFRAFKGFSGSLFTVLMVKLIVYLKLILVSSFVLFSSQLQLITIRPSSQQGFNQSMSLSFPR